MDLYAEELISNYEHPHNKGKLDGADAELHEYNPVCGDDITIYISVKGKRIADVKFDGKGCAISIGAASMLTDLVKGKTLAEVEKMGFNTVVGLLGIDPGPARAKCATIALKALKGAVFAYEHKTIDAETKSL
ncbi:iron-sulfur cluster assembly scaffold protein [Candidatus Marsarchaeota archaeon]|jgi:nitrogen fixation NifU-like protein|nr:iron-sulfur cluster assembly scaffold protein [Candidatus Marsarchaeota archaeon]